MLTLRGKTVSSRRTVLLLSLAPCFVGGLAFGQQLQGKVIDRNGAPQSGCQLDFSAGPGQAVLYHFVTNRDGLFYLNNVRAGRYFVLAGYGPGRQFSIWVTVGPPLVPDTLTANW